ncbi:hypothetical protein NC653_000886 [Populus alba x Populus x berolinensis]|uniref:Uncharacterized protein n=1 Tax=Populus alba x Populus x berolinensis TaxID=444605 RepID=A0AAD6RK32_9ROSI|nr:hypothetical protein NC653_000886 [Populus alba x Populus x berolinensis]
MWVGHSKRECTFLPIVSAANRKLIDIDILCKVRETLLQHKEIIFHGGVLGALCKCNEDNVYPTFSVWLCSRGDEPYHKYGDQRRHGKLALPLHKYQIFQKPSRPKIPLERCLLHLTGMEAMEQVEPQTFDFLC